ncbi:MAG: hypothetical protein IJN48_00330 [Clostridia bacterium]|nr:hypothetical protein [Clostridia bacterium]
MLFKFADFYVDIEFVYRATEELLSDYAVSEQCDADFSVSVSQSDIDIEAAHAVEVLGHSNFSRAYLERIVLLRKLCDKLISHDVFLMHGAVLEYDGRGYMFSAPSGTGKTTHILLWQQLFGKANVRIINGDKPFIRCIDGRFYAYGSPWCGKENFNTNARVPLSAVIFIDRDESNSIERIYDETAVLQRILGQIDVVKSADLAKQIELVGRLVENVPVYNLRCNMEPDAAKVAYEGIKK